MKPNDHGFTLIEIVIVMVLISIVAATVFTRSITADELNLVSRAEKIQAHIRYAQSMAMKGNDVWGINCIRPLAPICDLAPGLNLLSWYIWAVTRRQSNP